MTVNPDGVTAALSALDGSSAAAVRLLSGLTAEELDAVGGVSDLCKVAACRGVVRTVTRTLEDGEPEPYGYCSTCGHPVTN